MQFPSLTMCHNIVENLANTAPKAKFSHVQRSTGCYTKRIAQDTRNCNRKLRFPRNTTGILSNTIAPRLVSTKLTEPLQVNSIPCRVNVQPVKDEKRGRRGKWLGGILIDLNVSTLYFRVSETYITGKHFPLFVVILFFFELLICKGISC